MLIIVSGSAGVGKNTIITKLLEKYDNIKLLQTCTTRMPRSTDEAMHSPYIYLTKEEFATSTDISRKLSASSANALHSTLHRIYILYHINTTPFLCLLLLQLQSHTLPPKEEYHLSAVAICHILACHHKIVRIFLQASFPISIFQRFFSHLPSNIQTLPPNSPVFVERFLIVT